MFNYLVYNEFMKNIQLTCAHALVKFLIAQKTLIDGKKLPLSVD